MTSTTNPTGYFNIPDPSLYEPASAWDGLCQVCGCRLTIFDPAQLCGVCTRESEDD